jgi:hypothetical protein
MATEILVNDGGAPARILPFTAGEAISAGEVLKASTAADNTCLLATIATAPVLGVALVDAASGDMCSVISGRGVILNIQCTAETAGINLMVDGTAGQLDEWSDSPLSNQVVATTLEDTSSDGSGLHRCMLF